jgi:hypothetical protein
MGTADWPETNVHGSVGVLCCTACNQTDGKDLVRRALLDNAELVDILPTAFRDLHLELVAILRHLLEPGELSAEDQGRLVAATGLPMTELRQVLAWIHGSER